MKLKKEMDRSEKKENRTENEMSLSIIKLVKEITDNEIQNEYAKQLTISSINRCMKKELLNLYYELNKTLVKEEIVCLK